MGVIDMGIVNKKQTKANGKIVICDFKSLNPVDFLPLHNFSKKEMSKELCLISPCGNLYINSRIDGYDFLAGVFEIIIQESKYTLDQFCKMFKQKYSKITFANIADMNGTNEEKTQAFTLLCIPVELQRRKIEREYYSKIKPF